MKILVISFTIIISSKVYSQKTARQIYDENTSKVVYVGIYDKNKSFIGSGSGFLINSEGLIITNYHVIKKAFYAKVSFYDGSNSDANYIYNYNEDYDLAILKTFSNADEFVNIVSSDNVSIGDKIYAIGSPLGIENTITDGIISNLVIIDNNEYFQITNPISHGSSGGALFDEYGNLIGVTCASDERGQNLNYAIPSKYIKILLNKSFFPITLIEFQKKINNAVITEKYPPNENKTTSPGNNNTKIPDEDYKPDLGLTPIDYNFNASYSFNSSALSNDLPENVKLINAYSVSFAYMFNDYVGVGILYQNNNLKENLSNKKINLDFYRGDLIFKTSESRLKLIIGMGIGLANSQLVYNKERDNSSDSALMKIGKTQNLFLASFYAGIEFRFIQNVSIDINVPFDYILLNENNAFGLVSPSIGLNLMF